MQREIIQNASQLFRTEVRNVDKTIINQLRPLTSIHQFFKHATLFRKKKIRSILTILSAKAFNYEGSHHLSLAAIAELINISSVLHDFVNNVNIANQKIEPAILSGDFICSRVIEMTVEVGCMPVTKIISNVINTISEGQLLVKLHQHDINITENIYFDIIRRYKASLFAMCTQLGPILSERSQEEIEAMWKYGEHIGFAYQLTKDATNYVQDIANGKLTLPLVHTLQYASVYKPRLMDILAKRKTSNLSKPDLKIIYAAINDSNAIDYTKKAAADHIVEGRKYLSKIEDSYYKSILSDFTMI